MNLDKFLGLWCASEMYFQPMMDYLLRGNLPTSMTLPRRADDPTRQNIPVGNVSIALIEVLGLLSKDGSDFNPVSTIDLREEIRGAAEDRDVGAILLRVDSPGGETAGTADLAREVAAAAKRKPVHAFVEDLAAAAAYWAISSAHKIYANDATALIGAIGSFMGFYDTSKQAENLGIKAVVIKSGKFKGAGLPGTEITAEHEAHWHKLIDGIQAEFSVAVARGRGLSSKQVETLADGRLHPAGDALRLRLIDGIRTFDDVVEDLRKRIAE
jgi:signal peptide peptidase SppA